MALKTNSKKARENIQKYIMDNFTGEVYGIETPKTFQETSEVILEVFRNEKQDVRYSEKENFANWAAGLPSILDTCYYYNRSAVDDLGEILEETETEKSRFTETQAEELLSSLIYRELIKAEKTAKRQKNRTATNYVQDKRKEKQNDLTNRSGNLN